MVVNKQYSDWLSSENRHKSPRYSVATGCRPLCLLLIDYRQKGYQHISVNLVRHCEAANKWTRRDEF
jgi:hypothetical protein